MMKKFTTLFSVLALTVFGWQANAQILNQNAAWPNLSWVVGGTYTASSLLNRPDSTTNFTFDDDAAGSGSADLVYAESPVIDLTPAFNGGETWVNINGDYDYYVYSSEILSLDYWDADGSSWITLEVLTSTTTSTSDYQNCMNTGTYLTTPLDISSFTSTQLAGFKYRINYDDDASWQYGFCLNAPTIVSSTPPSCPDPTTLTVTSIATNSVDLDWTDLSGSLWHIQWDTTGFTLGTGNMVNGLTANTYNLTGLTAQTSYDFYVISDCGADSSNWVGPFSFTTACNVFAVPFMENFSSTSTSQNCWTVINNNNDSYLWDMDYTSNPLAGDEVAVMYTDGNSGNDDDFIVSPTITLTGNEQLRFHYRVESASEPNDFQVSLSTTGVGASNFTNILMPLTSASNITYQEQIINLAAYTGNVNIAFHVPAGTTDGWRLYIDSVVVEVLPSCPDPTVLTAMNITGNTADLGWTDPSGSLWHIEWDTTGFTPGTGNIVSGLTTNTNNLTGLTASTNYDFYVISDCGADSSNWVGPFTFTTTVSCQAPSNINALMINPTDALIGWTENGSATTWDIEWGNAGFALGTGTADTTSSNPYMLMPLMPETPYDFYVRSICGAGDSSTWVGPFTFITPCFPTPVTTFPWTEDFDGAMTPNMPCGWIVDNVNADAYTWETGTTFPNSGANAMQVRWNANEAANDWAFTPELQLTGSVSYQLSFAFSVAGGTFPEKLKVMYGAGQNVAGMTNLLFDSTMTNTTYETATILFTPPTTGSYYVGFHNYSDADMFRVYVDDVTIDIATAVENNMIANNISIYPNPTTGIFTIAGNVKNATVNVMSITGKVVYQNTITGNNTTIDLSNNAKGLYFVSISTEKGTETYKVVIQ